MSFLLSKLIWALLNPATLLLGMMLFAFVWHSRRPFFSRALVGLALIIFVFAATCPIGQWSVSTLERRFPSPELPGRVDGIVVLGGAIDASPAIPAFQPALNDAAERITAFVALARRYPDAKLVYSGGSGMVREQNFREADQALPLLQAMGLDPHRVIVERDSRNTWENALYSLQVAKPGSGQTWLLLTSAWHMPRSVGCFRKAGWRIIPYPVDFRGQQPDWLGFDGLEQLQSLAVAEREWIGLVSYHFMGRTDALFPKP